MSGAQPADPRSDPKPGEARAPDPHELWPRDFGRDGVSGLVSPGRAMRARDVSRPRSEEEAAAEAVLADLLARVDGRRPTGRPRTS